MDEHQKRTILRMIPYGLYVVTSKSNENNNSCAFTASLLSQASFKPPLIVMASQADSMSTNVILKNRKFAINFVDKNQQELVKFFFKPTHIIGDKLGDESHYEWFSAPRTGSPILKNALAYLECELRKELILGDHTILVGEIINAVILREGEPLLMSDTKWHYAG